MRYSTTTYRPFSLYSPEKALILLKEIGYDAIDYGSPCALYRWGKETIFDKSTAEFEAYFAHHAACAKAADLMIGQVHAPFPTWPESNDEAEFRGMMEAIKKSIRATAIMEAPYLVIHCAMRKGWAPDDDPAATRALNYKVFEELIPVAEREGVYLALENMPCRGIPTCTPEEMCDYIDMMASDRLVACLDTGHANITGVDCGDFARALGHRLKVLHIHDNDGRSDQHITPYMGTVNWKSFMQGLRDIGYQGTLSLESDSFPRYADEFMFPTYAEFELNVLKKLNDM